MSTQTYIISCPRQRNIKTKLDLSKQVSGLYSATANVSEENKKYSESTDLRRMPA